MKSSLKIVWKKKIIFLLSETLHLFLEQKYISFLETYFFFYNSYEFNYLSIFFTKADNKKHRHASAKASNVAVVKLDYLCKFFCSWFKHGQTSNVIWLSITWLLIFRLEDANKKPLFTAKPASIWIEISC